MFQTSADLCASLWVEMQEQDSGLPNGMLGAHSARRHPMTVPDDLVSFWLQAGFDAWFRHDAAFDDQLRQRFADQHRQAAAREIDDWQVTANGALALVLLLDQVPRNIFRGTAHAFATDGLARGFASHAIEAGFDFEVDPRLRIFFYMPFEHSEALADQDRSLSLVQSMGDAYYATYARAHRDAIVRFGRFPHRNAALGRASTAEEQAWLDAGGGFG
jgi:uncharacterized protein (DUF924 family)